MNGVLEKHTPRCRQRDPAELTQGQKDYFKTYKAFGKEALIQQKKAFEYAILEVDYLLLRLNYDKVDIDNDAKFVSFWLRVGRVERRLVMNCLTPNLRTIPTLTNYTQSAVLVFVFP
jgi:hypothetical protein